VPKYHRWENFLLEEVRALGQLWIIQKSLHGFKSNFVSKTLKRVKKKGITHDVLNLCEREPRTLTSREIQGVYE